MKKLGLLLGLSALLITAGGAIGQNHEFRQTHADYVLAGDVDLDIGVNFLTKDQSLPAYPECLHYFSPNSGDVSKGDSFALRMRNNTPIDVWFTFCPNLNGTLVKPNYSSYTEYTWVNGVQGTTTGRGWYLETRLPANFDGWIFLPKSAFTIKKDGDAPWTQNWNLPGWAYYIIMYGSTDFIDVDVGTIATGNYATGEIITKLVDWTVRAGLDGVVEDFNGTMLAKTRNNENLIPTAKFYNAIKNVDACNVSACQQAVSQNSSLFAQIRNDTANRSYFQTLKVTDYDAGDLGHEGGKSVTYTLAEKWLQIQATANGLNPSNTPMLVDPNKYSSYILIIAGSVLALVAVTLIIRKRKQAK